MKITIGILFVAFGLTSHAKKPVTSADLMKSSFCKEYSCDDTSPYKNKEGQTAMQVRLAKDPLNLDLLVLLNGSNLKQLTLKFTNEEGKVDHKALTALLRFLAGHEPSDKIVEQIEANALVKTKKDDLMTNEKVSLDDLAVTAGNVLKKPTVVIVL